jgi:hypothetical protein
MKWTRRLWTTRQVLMFACLDCFVWLAPASFRREYSGFDDDKGRPVSVGLMIAILNDCVASITLRDEIQ